MEFLFLLMTALTSISRVIFRPKELIVYFEIDFDFYHRVENLSSCMYKVVKRCTRAQVGTTTRNNLQSVTF